MKKYTFLFVTLFSALTCSAIFGMDWRWKADGNYYLRVNELGENDGWYYTRSCYCGQYKYYYDHRIVENVNITSNADVTVTYSNTWKEKLAEQVGRVKSAEIKYQYQSQDAKDFITAVQASGLRVDFKSLPGMACYPVNYQQQAGIAANGISVLTQGVFGQGSTAYANTYSEPQQVDWAYAQNSAQHFEDRAFDCAVVSKNGMNQNLALANSQNAELAKYKAAVNGIVTATQTTVTPTQIRKEWHYESGSNVGNNTRPPEPTPSNTDVHATQSLTEISIARGRAVIQNVCMKCHSGEAAKKNLNFQIWDQYTPEDRTNYADLALRKMCSNDEAEVMPPFKSGIVLSPADRIGVYDCLRSGL